MLLLLRLSTPDSDPLMAKNGGGRFDCDWNFTRPPIDMHLSMIIKYFFHVIYRGFQIKSIQFEVGHQEIRDIFSSFLLGGFDEINQGGLSTSLRWEPVEFVFLIASFNMLRLDFASRVW